MEGLETIDYLDNLCNRERFTEQGDALTFESEVMEIPSFDCSPSQSLSCWLCFSCVHTRLIACILALRMQLQCLIMRKRELL